MMRGVLVVVAALAGLPLADGAQEQPPPPIWQCPVKPVEPCFKHHGRLSSQNGIAFKVWLIGTTRMVALANEPPSFLDKYLDMTSPNHSYVYGDFNICPVEPDMPGNLRRVCVMAAERLVVQRVHDSTPPFRLLSTWPAGSHRSSSGFDFLFCADNARRVD